MDPRLVGAWLMMTRYLALCLLLATSVSVPRFRGRVLSRYGSDREGRAGARESSASPAEATADEAKSCERVTFSRSLKYGEDDLNVLDVATVASQDPTQPASRPDALLFVAGESFAGESGGA